MKFGKDLETNMVKIWEAHYIEYELLKRILTKGKTPEIKAEFHAMYDAQLKKVRQPRHERDPSHSRRPPPASRAALCPPTARSPELCSLAENRSRRSTWRRSRAWSSRSRRATLSSSP